VTTLWIEDHEIMIQYPAEARDLSSGVQTRFGAHPDCYPAAKMGSFAGHNAEEM
jgi:hypothetical protein